jgi:hypothetical protein
MSTALRERAAAMVARVGHEAGRVMPAADAARVREAVRGALIPRDMTHADDHDPRILAPGRVVRILIADAFCRDADVLCAAAYIDSVDPHLTGDRAVLGARAEALRAAVPLPARAFAGADGAESSAADDDDLVERLVTAGPNVALIALAERLDQARHLHFRPELPWSAFHAQVRGVYIPVAQRVSPPLAQRLQRWADAFERRRLRSRRNTPRTCEGTGQTAL